MSRLPLLAALPTMRKQLATLLITVTAACGGTGGSARDGGAQEASLDGPPAKGGPVKGLVDGGNAPGPAVVVTGPAELSDAIQQIGGYVTAHGLPVRQLTLTDLRTWFDENKFVSWTKPERALLEQDLALGTLGADWTLTLEQIVGAPGDPWRITLCAPPTFVSAGYYTSCGTVAEDQSLRLWLSEARAICQDPTHDLCDEPFVGPFASPDPVPLSPTVPVRVEPIVVAGEPAVPELAERDALAVSVDVSAETIPALVDYFAVGYDRAALEARLRVLLGSAPSRWTEVQEFLFGWVRERANTFPRSGENDVCHGPARLFYSDTLYNGEYDRSTEAVAVLLSDHYCRVADDAQPRFGDYLYNPGAHSARYILRDPSSGRDIVFSVQSGGISAYRFYWADEDMSGNPFGHAPLPDYRAQLVDTWRRCR